MRSHHSRSAEFREALETRVDQHRGPWNSVASDPNDPVALISRADTLRAAWRPQITDRIAFLEDRCRRRVVLDIGCVAHDVARMDSDTWLHRRLAAVAERCTGVDVLTSGVEAMRARGFDVVEHDLRKGLGPLTDRAPFDVVVAGEVIEHLESMDMLFSVASDALTREGEMLMTTPNPYAPHRIRAGRRGVIWENVDHVAYAFPSGIAELAERHGLVLAEAATTAYPPHRLQPSQLFRELKRRIKGSQWRNVGFSSTGSRVSRRVGFGPRAAALQSVLGRDRSFLGETFVYVIRRQHALPPLEAPLIRPGR